MTRAFCKTRKVSKQLKIEPLIAVCLEKERTRTTRLSKMQGKCRNKCNCTVAVESDDGHLSQIEVQASRTAAREEVHFRRKVTGGQFAMAGEEV